jgi:hypothetical protein
MGSAMKLLGLVTVLMLVFLAEARPAEICDVRKQVNYNLDPGDFGNIRRKNGSIDVRGFIYRSETWWLHNDSSLIACPCLNQGCIQHCASRYIVD